MCCSRIDWIGLSDELLGLSGSFFSQLVNEVRAANRQIHLINEIGTLVVDDSSSWADLTHPTQVKLLRAILSSSHDSPGRRDFWNYIAVEAAQQSGILQSDDATYWELVRDRPELFRRIGFNPKQPQLFSIDDARSLQRMLERILIAQGCEKLLADTNLARFSRTLLDSVSSGACAAVALGYLMRRPFEIRPIRYREKLDGLLSVMDDAQLVAYVLACGRRHAERIWSFRSSQKTPVFYETLCLLRQSTWTSQS